MVSGVYSAAKGNEVSIFETQLKVCASNSMATIHSKNTYIEENNLNNRFVFDDLLIINKLPDEAELNLYDIVTYWDKKTEKVIIHRIIAITQTEDGLRYTMRGDANPVNDSAKISYDDMLGIYNGQKLAGLGTLVRFAQSTFAIIAIITCVYVYVLEEILQKRLKKADAIRLSLISELDSHNDQLEKNDISTEPTPIDPEKEMRQAILFERRKKQEEARKLRAGKWEIIEDGVKFRFRLYDENGYVLCRSEAYASKKQCEQKMKLLGETIRDGRYEIYKDRRGVYQLKIYNANKRILLLGETHKSLAKAKAAAEAIGKLSQTAELIEREDSI